MKKKDYLITGGAGFIGSNLAHRLLELGNRVYIVDNLLTGLEDNIPKKAIFIKGDISKPKDIKKIPNENYKCVFHLAAQTSGELSNKCKFLDLTTNIYGTLLILNFAFERSIPRFIYSSSMSIYGNVERNPVNEIVPAIPISCYGISKLASEHYIRYFANKGLKTTIFRIFSAYGPRQNMANVKQGMVSIYMSYLLKNKIIHVKGSKERFRDFIYIDDIVKVFIESIKNKRTFGKTYNLGSGTKTPVDVLIRKMLRLFDKNEDAVIYRGSTSNDQFGLYADISKLQKDFGRDTRISLDEGLSRMAAWYKNTK